MKAVHITAHGGPEVLELVEVDTPEPGAGEVQIQVLGVSVNHLDLWVRRGMPGFKVDFPRIPGCDGTGRVLALGAGVQRLSVGQNVLLEPGYNDDLTSRWVMHGEEHRAPDYKIRGEHGNGFDAQVVVLPEHYLLPLPKNLDPMDAAASPLVFLTAWGALVERASIHPEDTVLVLGAGSGVGSAGIQIARARGCRVLTTAGSESKRKLGLELGAEAAFDHYDPEWPSAVRKATHGEGADVVFEHIGPATWAGSMRVLARNGRLVTCGGTTGSKANLLLPHLFIKNQTILGSTMGPKSSLPLILEHMAAGTYRPVVDRVMPMSEVREAHRLLEARAVSGKIVLDPSA